MGCVYAKPIEQFLKHDCHKNSLNYSSSSHLKYFSKNRTHASHRKLKTKHVWGDWFPPSAESWCFNLTATTQLHFSSQTHICLSKQQKIKLPCCVTSNFFSFFFFKHEKISLNSLLFHNEVHFLFFFFFFGISITRYKYVAEKKIYLKRLALSQNLENLKNLRFY